MVAAADLVTALSPLGFERAELIHGSTYQDCSTVIVTPTRGQVDYRFMSSCQNLIAPMNQKRGWLFAVGDEVGVAYNKLVQQVLDHEVLSKFKYLLTIEDDNLVQPDAHIRLLESIALGFDAVGGLYWTKGDINMPQAYGDPHEYARTGVLEFRPRDVVAAVQHGHVVEVNGLAMGCTLYRLDLFREIPPPWFVTVADWGPDRGVEGFTQDLYFCKRAKQAGKTFAVDCRVRVGHLDVESGVVY